jgi:AcrR family transcriptional regulator
VWAVPADPLTADGDLDAGRERPVPSRSRRTQAERRAATRAALLDATIAGLVEHGYARLTTSQIVDIAGVTRGAQAHYFSTKAELVVEALTYLADQIGTEMSAHPPALADGPRAQFAALLDRWWTVFSGEMFLATAELWVAARTDAELRGHLSGFARSLNDAVIDQSSALAPKLTERTDHRALLVTAMAAITGLSLVRFAAGDKAVDLMWSRTRDELLTLVAD